MLILNVLYVLIAIAMIALILMQRGAGAQAGSGFGAGASATVFGSRGASNFLSKATKWLAITFFGISLFMAWHASRGASPETPNSDDLGAAARLEVPKAPPTGPTGIPKSIDPTSVGAPGAPAQPPAAPVVQPVPVAPPQAAPQPPANGAAPTAAPAATPAQQGG
jgi:preprotein translocase subunit SecG